MYTFTAIDFETAQATVGVIAKLDWLELKTESLPKK